MQESVHKWREAPNHLPEDAPNHFVVNVLPDKVEAFRDFLRQADIDSAELYPLVRGRLVSINGDRLDERVSPDDERAGAVHRELNLTWSDTLPGDNSLTAGRWWQAGDEGEALVSVETGVAERLNAKLGDQLTFSFGSGELTAKIVSLRTVQWDSFRPNFFMIFPPGVLDPFPATYMTSFYLPQQQKKGLARMIREFPAVTVIDLDRIMEQVRRILTQVTLAVEYVLVFVLLATVWMPFLAVLYSRAALSSLGEVEAYREQQIEREQEEKEQEG